MSVLPSELKWYPRVKAWSQRPEYLDAPFASRAIVDAALGVFMDRGCVPEGEDALRNAIGAAGWKEYPKAYPAARVAIVALVPLWQGELDASLAFVQKQRDNGGKGGRPSKPKPEPKGKPEKTHGLTHGKATANPEANPTETTVTDTVTDTPNGVSSETPNGVSGDDGSSREPTIYQKIEFVLWGRAARLAKLNSEPVELDSLKPHERTVRSHLKGTTGLLPIIERLGVYEAVDVLAWVGRKMSPQTSYLKVLDGLDVIMSQMQHGQDWVVRNRAPQGGTPDLRGHLETDLFE